MLFMVIETYRRFEVIPVLTSEKAAVAIAPRL